METFASGVLTTFAILLAIPVIVFCLEIFAAIILPNRQRGLGPEHEARRRLAVLVPAHNEGKGLLTTLADIRSQLRPGDRLLVVADNCADDTATLARASGAEVVERTDSAKRGKGYALDCGLQHLGSDPPEIVIVVDADCRIADKAIHWLATTCARVDRPVQALYLMRAPAESRINHQVAEFAWRVKNRLRPLGLNALGLPCQLVGTGMAFPWETIRAADLANGWIVEDLKLGLDLALAGHAPLFCHSAVITSEFASSIVGARIQRERWEQGHIGTILKFAPRLLCTAIARRNWGLMALTLDLMVPPLSLLVMLVGGMLALTTSVVFLGFSAAAFYVSGTSFFVLVAAAFLAWTKCGRDVLPPSALLLVARYVLGKLGLYRQIASGRTDTQWIRTDRTKSK